MKPIFSRRHLLGSAAGIGIAGAAATTLPGVMSAASAAPLTPSAVAPALEYTAIAAYDFYPYRSSVGYDYNVGTWPTEPTTPFLKACFNLPNGSIIREVSVYARNGGASGMTYILQRAELTTGAGSVIAAGVGALVVGTNVSASSTVQHVVTNATHAYSLQVTFTDTTGLQELYGARLAYEPLPVVTSLAERVLDTRGGAKIANAEERVIDLSTVVPVGSRFALCTITLDQTEQSGYLTAFADGEPVPPTSNVNWAVDGESVANTVMVALSAGRRFRIRGGGGKTHVIVDVTGAVA